ncbi:unnamed protein product [Acanthosepion pharaonis]|uniref:Uncharacterized protein n=1 Tax=Acanthosepion pharaonis TaxID=158019 RepID=A0A812CV61_ACAPH|nr:unnamed protein product [Sepia pharaonis]
MPSRRESQGEVGVIGANLVGQGTGRLPPQTRDQNFDNRERNNSTTPIVYFPSRKRSSSSSLAIPTAGSSSSLGYRPVPSRAHRTIQHSNSTGTLTSIESGAHTMTSLEWVRCGSGGKICIFLVLGIILLMLGIFIGAFYLNIQQLTSSSTLTEVLPNYVIALSVMLIGFSVIILFWKRSRVLLFIAMVLNVCGFILCLLTTILTGTHILKPIVNITYCEYRAASKTSSSSSSISPPLLSSSISPPLPSSSISPPSSFWVGQELFKLPFYGSSNCEIKTLLPKMLYVLCANNLIAALICAIAYIITLRVYRMKKNKEDELDDEIYDPEDMHHINRDDSYLSSRCHDNHYSGIPPSPESPVPLLEAVSSRGISIVDKTSILKDLLPDIGKKRLVKRSQSFSYHGRSVEGTCDSMDDSDGKIFDRTHPRHMKGRNVPCRTLSETVRPSSAGTPDNSKKKFSKQEAQHQVGSEDSLDNRQLLLILGLHMRNIQEQHEAEIQSIQQEHFSLSCQDSSTLLSYFSPGDDKQERGNISGTSTEFSPPGNNPNRSNASGTSVDQSPSAFQDVRKVCDTPIAHPKMLPTTPTDSPTSANYDGQSRTDCDKSLKTLLVYSPEDNINYEDTSGSKVDFSRNVTGESVNFSPPDSHSQYLSTSRVYSPSRHIVETDKFSPSSPLAMSETSSRGNTSGASAKMSPCRNLPHPPVAQMLTPKMVPAVKEVIMNSRTASEPPKRNTKYNKREEYTSSIRSRSASLSPHRNIGDDSLGPREQPYGQYGPYNRKIEGSNVYLSQTKKDQDDSIYKGQKWNPDIESQPRKEKPPPPYPSRTSHNGPCSKLHGESRKNLLRGRGNFRVGPEGVSYRRKKIERLDMSFDQADDLPRSELDVEGDVDREELYPTPEKNRIFLDYEYQKHLEDQQNFLLLRDKGSGSDSDAVETII